MKSLRLILAAVVIAGGILAPAALAKKRRCPPGSNAAEYCQYDPGDGAHWRHRHHHHRSAPLGRPFTGGAGVDTSAAG